MFQSYYKKDSLTINFLLISKKSGKLVIIDFLLPKIKNMKVSMLRKNMKNKKQK